MVSSTKEKMTPDKKQHIGTEKATEHEEKNEEAKYVIQLDRDSCIGTTACIAQDPTEWKLASDGKVDLHNSTPRNEDIWERTITQEEYSRFLTSARACPVNAIRILNKKTGERIV